MVSEPMSWVGAPSRGFRHLLQCRESWRKKEKEKEVLYVLFRNRPPQRTFDAFKTISHDKFLAQLLAVTPALIIPSFEFPGATSLLIKPCCGTPRSKFSAGLVSMLCSQPITYLSHETRVRPQHFGHTRSKSAHLTSCGLTGKII